jgi:nitrogen fixation protein FixH
MAEARPRGWWYPYIFVGLFAIVIAVNGTLAYFATSTFTGLETEGAYDKGLAYNTNLAMARAQAELGWTVDTTAEPVAGEGARMALTVTYKDRDGKPVEGLEVSVRVIRPTTKGHDHTVTLEPMGKGVYGIVHPLPLRGVWDLDIAALGKDVSYQHAKRVVIQ